MTWWSQKNWADSLVQMDQQVQKDLVEKIKHRYPERSDFCGGRWPSIPDFRKDPVWVIDPIDGTNNFVTQRKILRWWWLILKNGIGQFGLIYDVMRDHLFMGVGNSLFITMSLNWRPLWTNLRKTFWLLQIGMLEKNDWGMADLGMDSLGIRVYGSAGISFQNSLRWDSGLF